MLQIISGKKGPPPPLALSDESRNYGPLNKWVCRWTFNFSVLNRSYIWLTRLSDEIYGQVQYLRAAAFLVVTCQLSLMGISFEGLVGSRKADGVHRSVTASWASEGRDKEMGSDRTSVCSRASRRPPKHVGRCSDAGLWECHHSRAWPASLLLKQIVYSISYAAVVTQAYLLALLYTRAISDKKLVGTGTLVLFDCFQVSTDWSSIVRCN